MEIIMLKPERRKRIITAFLFLTVVLALLISLPACSSGTKIGPIPSPTPATTATTPAANTTAAISYAKDIQVIFNTNCVVCHQGAGAGQSGLSLEPRVSYGNIVGVPSTENPNEMRVKAGAPDQSYLIAKISGTQVAAGGGGAQMPYQAAPLSQVQINLLSQWISQGALNN
jgi:mono/diheme cytochrome c family protein